MRVFPLSLSEVVAIALLLIITIISSSSSIIDASPQQQSSASQSSTAAIENFLVQRNFPRQTYTSKQRTPRHHHSQIKKSTKSMINDYDDSEPFLANTHHQNQKQYLETQVSNDKTTVGEVENDSELVNIFFMHRHGARTSAIVRDNVPDYNGCVLSPQGELMAKSLGKFLNERYNGTAGNNFTDKFFEYFPKSYDPFKVNSWSTDFERTIRTGTAVLQSMFTTQEMIDTGKPAVAPYLQHLPQDVDFMLSYYYSWPAALLHQYELDEWFPKTDKYTESLFSEQNLTLLGKYLNASKLCKDTPTTCVVVCEDFVSCELSNNPPGYTPLLNEVVPLLDKLLHMYHLNVKNNYFSIPGDSFWKGVGFYAAEVIRDMMRKSRAAIITPSKDLLNDPATPVIHHYSAHDVTVYGLLVALGIVDENTTDIELNVPPFTTTTLFELYRNGTMKFFYVICNQTYNSDHKFEIREGPKFRVNCMHPTPQGQKPSKSLLYKSNVCPFEDIERAVTYTMETLYPKTSGVIEETMCYADPDDLNRTKCHEYDQEGNSSECQNFRSFCQDVACSSTWLNGERFANYSEEEENDKGDQLSLSSSSSKRRQAIHANETFVFNTSSSNSYECIKIVEFPGLRKVQSPWANILKNPGSMVAVFFASVLLGIVFGAAGGAFWFRRNFFMVANRTDRERESLLIVKHGDKNHHGDVAEGSSNRYQQPREAYATDAEV